MIDTRWAGRKLGRYKVLSVLGQGGMGVVWRGHDETLRRDVALKILSRSRKSSVGLNLNTELFMQEARAIAKLQHPHVVAIYEVAQASGQIFLSLELMEGGTLKEYVDRHGAIAARELFAMMVGPAKALALAHKRGIIHRDIKPGNLMFDDHGHLKLMDFGLAEVAKEAASERLKGKAVGSLGWVAPETVRGLGTTPVSDIYSLGLVMLYALMGKPWLHADSRSKLLALHQNPPELDLNAVKGLTPRAKELLKKCLAVEPAERFATADELMKALQACADEDPLAKFERRKSYTAIALVASIFGLLIGVGAVAYYFQRLADQTNEMGQPVAQFKPRLTPGLPPVATKVPAEGSTKSFASMAEATVPWPEVPELVDVNELAFVADVKGEFFHLASCEKAREILACNLKNYPTFELAQTVGLKPCPDCRPKPGPKPEMVMGPGQD
ncbi:MAG: serine/threonine protein kinase [Planctomycetes bacterium]|nr:serine/threonine protein kinase [Planctomycetota bacterium]